MTKIELYDASNIKDISWPATPNGQYEEKFLTPLIESGVSSFIDNIDLQMGVIKIDNMVLPLAITQGNTKNSWVCSPYAHYIDYGKAEVEQMQNKAFKNALTPLLNILGNAALRGKINDIVYVNNRLFATDIYPQNILSEHISPLLNFLKTRFPRHAIIFRSLNPTLNLSLQKELKKQGSSLIASRFVYIFDARKEGSFDSRIVKSDLKLWKNNPYKVQMKDLLESDEEIRHLMRLYQHLYIQSHSKLNPQYNFSFFKKMNDHSLLSYILLWEGEEIKGAAGYFIKDGVLYCPVFGYDKSDNDHKKIYRILNTGLMLAAKNNGSIFHMSAGASFYKKIRQAEGCLESNAVYYRHLPFWQRMSWKMIKTLMNGIGPWFMKRH